MRLLLHLSPFFCHRNMLLDLTEPTEEECA
jgi:hypothetical protein